MYASGRIVPEQVENLLPPFGVPVIWPTIYLPKTVGFKHYARFSVHKSGCEFFPNWIDPYLIFVGR
jgi:hypothetical protein